MRRRQRIWLSSNFPTRNRMCLTRTNSCNTTRKTHCTSGVDLQSRCMVSRKNGCNGRDSIRHKNSWRREKTPLHRQKCAAWNISIWNVRGSTWKCARTPFIIGNNWQANSRWLHSSRHASVGRVHNAPCANGRRCPNWSSSNGFRLWNVHRWLWSSLWTSTPWLHDDSSRCWQHRAPHPNDWRLWDHSSRCNSIICNAHLWSRRKNGLWLGKIDVARWTFRRRALPSRLESWDWKTHAHRLHRQLRFNRGYGARRFRWVLGRAKHATHSRRPLPLGSCWPEDWRASARRTNGWAGANSARQRGYPRFALQDTWSNSRCDRAMLMRKNDSSHAKSSLTLRRHADYSWNKRFPKPNRRCFERNRWCVDPLSNRSRQRDWARSNDSFHRTKTRSIQRLFQTNGCIPQAHRERT